MPRLLAILAFWLMAFAAVTPAAAHASFISSDPADSSLLKQAPSRITLTFNEPVTIVRLRLFDAAGGSHDLGDAHLEGAVVVATLPAGLPEGTNAVSWRVVSTDSHPIGGTFLFSVGKTTTPGVAASEAAAPGLYPAMWTAGFILNLGLFLGIGGAFFMAWIAGGAMPRIARRITKTTLVAGIVAAPVSLGLEGLDIRGVGLDEFGSPSAWTTAIGSTYGSTVLVAVLALALALVATSERAKRYARVSSGVALLGLGVALSLSGHAADAPPRSLTWVAVFLHGVAVAFWTGSLIPLALLLWQRDPKARPALVRFSWAIPFAIVPLVAAGVLLVAVQFTAPSDLWTTDYGRILAVKLALVAALFALAAANRFGVTERALRGDQASNRALVRSIGMETATVVAIFALIALWRFTPPPRAIEVAAAATSLPAVAQMTSTEADTKATITVTPGRAGPVRVSLEVTDLALTPIEPKKVSVSFANPDAGIEPIVRNATLGEDGRWRIDGLTLPLAGSWTVEVDVLIKDFVQANLEATITIRP
jgi:copper transport protein